MSAAAEQIPHRLAVPDHPATYPQQAIWLEQQRDPLARNSGYFAVTFRGDGGSIPDATALRAAAAVVLGRHPALRSVLRHTEDGLRDVLLDVVSGLRFSTVDVPCPPGQEEEAVAAWTAEHEEGRVWDLGDEPPIRFLELVHGCDRSSLVFSVHHAGFDGRSKFVVAQDFALALNQIRRFGTADPEPMPRLVLPPADEATCDRAVAYWRGVLERQSHPMTVPEGRRPGTCTVKATPERRLESSLVARLGERAAGAGISMFSLLMAAVTRQHLEYDNDIVPLAVAADVSDDVTRNTAGMQVNVVPVALDPAAGADDAALLRHAAHAADRLNTFRRVPFGMLTARLPRPGAARRLLTQVGLSFPRPPIGLAANVVGVRTHWTFLTPNTSTTFERTFQFRRGIDHAVLRLDYRPYRMGEAEAIDYLDDLCTALETMAGLRFGVPRPSGDRSAPRTSAEPAGLRAGDLVVLGPGTPDPVRVLQTGAAARAVARVLDIRDPLRVPSGVRRVCGSGEFIRAVPAGQLPPDVDLVLPLEELACAVSLRGRAVGAYLVAEDRCWGWVQLADDAADPPLLSLLESTQAQIYTGAGTPAHPAVGGRLSVSAGAGCPLVVPWLVRRGSDGAFRLLGPVDGRWLATDQGLLDVPMLERVLHELPGVRRALVIGEAGRGGALIGAALVQADHAEHPSLTLGKVRAHLHVRAAGTDLPTRIRLVATLPVVPGRATTGNGSAGGKPS